MGDYKVVFKNIKWGTCYTRDQPWKEVCVDGDSLTFRYILDYSEQLTISNKEIGSFLYDRKTYSEKLIYGTAVYCNERLERDLGSLSGYTLVFGRGFVERKRVTIEKYELERVECLRDLLNFRIENFNLDSRGILRVSKRLIISSRSEVLDLLKKMVKVHFKEVLEPDMVCPKICPVVVSEDYDLMLFGAMYLVKKVENGTIKFIGLGDVLDFLGLENRKQLVIVATLCGTDYNEGVKGIGPSVSKSIALRDPENPIVDKEVVEFFMIGKMIGSDDSTS
jgi:hypothetical protein